MLGSSPLDLLGSWQLARTIEDRLVGATSTVDGETILSAEADGRIRWHETGILHHGGNDVPVFRTLYVERSGDAWVVTFEDGRDFHPWALDRDVVHPCGADTYTGHVDVDSAERWTVTWTTLGPAKDYTMVSILTR
ncbi:MAG TPA: DUF6314 family protein [Aeromicrobium sp.]|nr:DUF6314 family protein [Aeromicrobium sp.]